MWTSSIMFRIFFTLFKKNALNFFASSFGQSFTGRTLELLLRSVFTVNELYMTLLRLKSLPIIKLTVVAFAVSKCVPKGLLCLNASQVTIKPRPYRPKKIMGKKQNNAKTKTTVCTQVFNLLKTKHNPVHAMGAMGSISPNQNSTDCLVLCVFHDKNHYLRCKELDKHGCRSYLELLISCGIIFLCINRSHWNESLEPVRVCHEEGEGERATHGRTDDQDIPWILNFHALQKFCQEVHWV